MGISLAPPRIRPGHNVPAGQPSGVVQGITIWNHSPIPRYVYVYFPGKYTTTLNVPDKPKGDPLTSLYVFMNGIYYFANGASLLTTAGYMANTSDGLPHYAVALPSYGLTDLPAAADGTDGVEFVLD